MLIEALNRLFSSSCGNSNEERQIPTVTGVEKTTVDGTKPNSNSPYEHDIKVLDEKFGLKNGMTIELTLQEALLLLPRERKRSDAYKGLVSELNRSYGVQLIIGKTTKNSKS